MASDIIGKGALALLSLAEVASPGAVASEGALDDGPLVPLALRGERAAWEKLIARHNQKVIVSLLARGVLLERARDIAQETWTRLIANQQSGRLRELTLPGLAIVQAGYLAASDWRRRGRQLVVPVSPSTTITSSDPETQLLGREALARLELALGDCSPTARQVFELSYQQPELGYEQVAATVGLSTQRVKQIVCEVRKRLRQALEEVR